MGFHFRTEPLLHRVERVAWIVDRGPRRFTAGEPACNRDEPSGSDTWYLSATHEDDCYGSRAVVNLYFQQRVGILRSRRDTANCSLDCEDRAGNAAVYAFAVLRVRMNVEDILSLAFVLVLKHVL